MPPPISRTSSAPPATHPAPNAVQAALTCDVPEPAALERELASGLPRLGLSEARAAYYQILDRLQARQRRRLRHTDAPLSFEPGAMELLAALPRPQIAPRQPSWSKTTGAAPVVATANAHRDRASDQSARQLDLAVGPRLEHAPATGVLAASAEAKPALSGAGGHAGAAEPSLYLSPAEALEDAAAASWPWVSPPNIGSSGDELWAEAVAAPWLDTPAVAPARGLEEPDVVARSLPAAPSRVDPGARATPSTRALAASDVMHRYDVAQLRRAERQLHDAVERAETAEVPPQLCGLLHPNGSAEHWAALPKLEVPEHCTGEAPLRRLTPFDVADKLMRGEHEGRRFLCVRFFDLLRRQSGLVVLAQVSPHQRGTQDWMVINPQHFGPLSAPHQHLEPHLLGLSFRHPERLPNAPAAQQMFAALRTLVHTGTYLGRSKFVLRARLVTPPEGWVTTRTVRSTPTVNEESGPTADELAMASGDLRAASPPRESATPTAAAAELTPSLLLTTPPASPPASPRPPREGARAPTPTAGRGAETSTEIDVGDSSDAVSSASSVAELAPSPAWMPSAVGGAAPRGRRESDAHSGDDPVRRPRPRPRNVRFAAPPTLRGKRAPNVPRRPLATASTLPEAPSHAGGTPGASQATGQSTSATVGPRPARNVGASSTSQRTDLLRPQRTHHVEGAPGRDTHAAMPPFSPMPRAAGPARDGAPDSHASATRRLTGGSSTSGAARATAGAGVAPTTSGPARVRPLTQQTNLPHVVTPAPGRTHLQPAGPMSSATSVGKGRTEATTGAPPARTLARGAPPLRAPVTTGRAAAAGPSAALAVPADGPPRGPTRAGPQLPRPTSFSVARPNGRSP